VIPCPLVADFVAKVGCCRWAVGRFVKERPGVDPPALTPLYATPTLRDAQNLSGGWSSDQRCEPPQVLGDGGQNELNLGASWTTQSKPAELQDALQACEPHLDSFAHVATSQSLRCQQTTGQRPGRAHGRRAGSGAMGLSDSTATGKSAKPCPAPARKIFRLTCRPNHRLILERLTAWMTMSLVSTE